MVYRWLWGQEGGGGYGSPDLGGFEDLEEGAVLELAAMVLGDHVGELVEQVVRLQDALPLPHVPAPGQSSRSRSW